ncbi:hypothetical protein GCM10009798_26510 [Nocardioides panacihumi]|uniref:ABC3 transporter permease C-terminal domain-containing protein n=1 Tax=Nocardioides panacihumi TaxID=400774 RepID=A0ABN2R7Y0_9ACTN
MRVSGWLRRALRPSWTNTLVTFAAIALRMFGPRGVHGAPGNGTYPDVARVRGALGYRRGQAITLALLAALLTACAVFAPLYDRSMRQALIDVKLERVSSLDTSVRLSVQALEGVAYKPGMVPSPEQLAATIPAGVRRDFRAPVTGWTANADEDPRHDFTLAGDVMWRPGVCDRVRVVAGRCPDRPGEVLISTGDVSSNQLALGQELPVVTQTLTPVPEDQPLPRHELHVVGLYEEIPGRGWFRERLTGWAGQFTETVGPAHRRTQPKLIRHDAWLTVPETFTDPAAPLPNLRSSATFELLPDRVDVDELHDLTRLAGLSGAPALRTGAFADVVTGLPDIAAQVSRQVDDAHVVAPLIALPLAVLCLLALWLALATAADQSRPEIAVARLRGLGAAGARRVAAGDLVPPVVLGAVPGALAGVGGAWLAAKLLPGHAGVELRAPVWAASGAAALVVLTCALAVAARVARTPVDRLIRRSASLRRGWRLGALDGALLTCCAVAAVAYLAGSVHGTAVYVAPAVFALLVGLLLAHVLPPLATGAGRALLRGGRTAAGLAFLDSARSVALRPTVTALTVAAALTVFATDAVTVAARNRELAARQEAGAPAVLELASTDVAGIDDALKQLHDGAATPVVTITPPGAGAVMTVAVRPAGFARVALIDPGTLPTDWTRRLTIDGPHTPVLATTAADGDSDRLSITDVDGRRRPADIAGTVPRIPGAPARAVLADLDALLATGPPGAGANVWVWLADPALVHPAIRALEQRHIGVTDTRTLTDARRDLDETIPTWSTRLGLLTALGSLASAVLLVAVATAGGRRERAYDLATLWLAGVPRGTVRRLALTAHLPAVITATFAGCAAGLVGARVAMPHLPLFGTAPEVDTLDLGTSWVAVAAATGGCLVVLGLATVLAGQADSRRTTLDRLRRGT